jgi:hypothetical protein
VSNDRLHERLPVCRPILDSEGHYLILPCPEGSVDGLEP